MSGEIRDDLTNVSVLASCFSPLVAPRCWRILLIALLSGMMFTGTLPRTRADEPEEVAGGSRDSRALVTPKAEASIAAGLKFLAIEQHPDGAFGNRFQYRKNVGVSGLAGLAFLASGSTPGRGPYGEQVSRTLDYVLSCSQTSGFITEPGSPDRYHGPMYGHGFATLFLAEAYGTTPRDDVGDALRRAVRLIVDTQNDRGGWRYNPRVETADISVTVCQAMALRAARNAGISVPKETIDRIVSYIEQMQNNDGGFKYQMLRASRSDFPRSAAAVVALYTSGVHEGEVIDRGLQYLKPFQPSGGISRSVEHYYYGQYYAVQAAWHAGGDFWLQWYPAVRDELLEEQNPDGSWPETWIGPEYATAMSLLVLQMPNNLLPIFER